MSNVGLADRHRGLDVRFGSKADIRGRTPDAISDLIKPSRMLRDRGDADE